MFFEGTCQRFSYSFDLHDSVGSTILKNIPTNSSGDTVVVEDRDLACVFLINLDG